MSTIMTHKRLVSAFKKAGCTVTQMERRGNPSYVAENPKNGKRVEWHTQPKFVLATKSYDETDPITTYVVERNPDTDISTDLFMDRFFHSIRSAVAAVA